MAIEYKKDAMSRVKVLKVWQWMLWGILPRVNRDFASRYRSAIFTSICRHWGINRRCDPICASAVAARLRFLYDPLAVYFSYDSYFTAAFRLLE